MSISTGATDVVGGGAGYGFGGGFGFPPVGLFGVFGGFGNRGFGNDFNGNDRSGITVLEQNVSDLRKDVADNGKEIHVLGNEVAGMFAQQNLAFTGEFRNLDNQICDVEKTQLQTAYAQSLQAFQNTQAIQNQVTAFQVANDAKFCNLETAIHADGDATRALINSIEMQNLRDALASERRSRDNREIEINVTQTNQQTQNQLQAQLQSQNQFLASMFNSLGDQVNRATNSVVQVGSGLVAGGQSNNQANTKVNS